MKVLFETNVDVAVRLFDLVDRDVLEGFLCATTLTTIDDLAQKAVGRGRARRHIADLMAMFEIAPVGRLVLRRALDLGFDDYEDAVLHEAARASNVDAIVTRHSKDFREATLPVFDPARLLAAALVDEGAG